MCPSDGTFVNFPEVGRQRNRISIDVEDVPEAAAALAALGINQVTLAFGSKARPCNIFPLASVAVLITFLRHRGSVQ
jgi:hypothetical protein